MVCLLIVNTWPRSNEEILEFPEMRDGFGSFKGIEGYCNYNRIMPFAGAAP